jgi:hypothetical protein
MELQRQTEIEIAALTVERILSPAVHRELIRLAEQYHLPTDHWIPYPCGRWQIAGACPTTFRLAVNLRAAKAIGLTILASFILLADEVIE